MSKMKKTMIRTMTALCMLFFAISVSPKVSYAATAETAPTVETNGVWIQETAIEARDEHWYKFVVPSDGNVNISLMNTNGDLDTQIYSDELYKVGKYQYISRSGADSVYKTTVMNYDLSKGSYYFQVKAGHTEFKYKLKMTYKSFQANDGDAISFDSPQNYVLGSNITGAFTLTDEDDWYRFDVTKDGSYILMCNFYRNGSSSGKWKIYNTGFEMKATGFLYDQVNEEITLKKGTYYLQFEGYSTGKYIFSISQQPCKHTYKNTIVKPTYFKQGYTLQECIICGDSQKVNYTSKRVLSRGSLTGRYVPGNKTLKVYWSKVTNATGYQVRCCRYRDFGKSVKSVNVSGQTKTSVTLTKLLKKKNYYVQVRPYKTSGSQVVYGKWSAVKSYKTK